MAPSSPPRGRRRLSGQSLARQNVAHKRSSSPATVAAPAPRRRAPRGCYSQTLAEGKFTVAFAAGNAGHFTGAEVFGTTIPSALLPPPSFFT